MSKTSAVALCFICVAACSRGSGTTHDLVVNLRTDLVPVEEFASVELVLTPREGGGSAVEQRLPNLSDGYLPAGSVAELAGIRSGSYRLGLSLLAEDGTSLIERPVLLDMQGSLAVTVPITRSCLNVQCA